MARPENDYCIYKCIYNFIGPACEVLIATHLYYVHLLLTMLHLLFLLTTGKWESTFTRNNSSKLNPAAPKPANGG